MPGQITQPLIPATIEPHRSMGPFDIYLTLEEIATDQMEITQHPVQRGKAVTDHAYPQPAALALRLQFAPEEEESLSEKYEALRTLQSERIPFDVTIGKRVYTDMLIQALVQQTDYLTETVLFIQIALLQITFVDVVAINAGVAPAPTSNSVTSPSGKQKGGQQNPDKTGTTAKSGSKQSTPSTPPTETTPQRKTSVLFDIFANG
ncbi:MAG: phage baseplate protein [Burkholderiales bacterium]